MRKSVVICPFCDNEQSVDEEKHVVTCDKCGKPFNADPFRHNHPEEFWANPDTSARF
jgi:uncharacterized CHY-type Zn-finger protein